MVLALMQHEIKEIHFWLNLDGLIDFDHGWTCLKLLLYIANLGTI
jgi:hypothetical protein